MFKRLNNHFGHQRGKKSQEIPQKLSRDIKNNPYLQSRTLWNDVFGQTEKYLHFSLGLNAVLVLGLIASAAGIVILANQRSIKPYPFIIHGEHVLTSTEESQAAVEHLKPQLANVLAKGFIKNLRRVSIDKHVNYERQMAALAVTNQEALAVTQQYFEKHQIDSIAKKQVNAVKITSSLQNSEHNIVIRWQEIWRTPKTGEVLKQEHYVAEISYQFDTPSTHELVLKYNPLGFYITHLSWSLEKVN